MRVVSGWRFGATLVLSFAAWNLASGPLLPAYAGKVAPAAQRVANSLRLHGAEVVFTSAYPQVRWQARLPSQGAEEGVVACRLLTYNLTLYLALLTAIPHLTMRRRAILLVSGLLLFFGFHVVDLLLAVESALLTRLQPQHYAFWRSFSLWFVAVKFYHSFSVMALKQVFPVFVLFLQWHVMRKFVGWDIGGAALCGGMQTP